MSIIIEKGECLSYTKNPLGKGGAYHLYNDPLIEVNLFKSYPGITKHLLVPDNPYARKVYTILKGSIIWLEEQKTLGFGTVILLTHKSEPFVFRVLEETEVLVQSYEDNTLVKTKLQNRNVQQALFELQEKDRYTFEHSMTVAGYVEKMAIRLGYRGIRMRNIIWAATYHDVGKVFIEDKILNKKGKLTESEYEHIKTHVIKGKELICNAFDENVFNIVLQHHERLDGSGYPNGLVESEISQEAKIIGICDSYHAMIEDRVYKKGKTPFEAMEELRSLADQKYDRNLVELAIEIFKYEDIQPRMSKDEA